MTVLYNIKLEWHPFLKSGVISDIIYYGRTIRRKFPDLEVVEGTHPFHDLEATKTGIKELISQKVVTPPKMNDLIFKKIKLPADAD
ncbi:MAG: hypothetical protein JRJ85_28595 [Deltaproteobacteria bacterium]|nr:hypothetical protein [Deltaproteobacteria bacterium]